MALTPCGYCNMETSMQSAGWGLSTILAILTCVFWAQLSGANKQVYTDRQQMYAANQQIAALRSEDADALVEAMRAKSDAATARAVADKTLSELSKAEQDLAYAQKPEIPCTLGFYAPGFLSSEHGKVAKINNVGADQAVLNIQIDRPSDKTSKSITNFVIDAHQSRELGENEGWAFVSGDKITLSEADHKDGSWTTD